MESISSVTSCGKLIMYYTSFVAEEQELFWPARAISGIQFFSPQARRQAQVSELEEEEICVCDGINQFSDELWQADYVLYFVCG